MRYILLVTWCLGVVVTCAYAFNLDSLKTSFLSGDYKTAITEGEKVLAGANKNEKLDELYYFLGLSYLKDGNFLRASDIFEIILREFKGSRFQDEAKLGLGDAYFLKGDYSLAQNYYNALLNEGKNSSLKPALYYRLSKCAAKLGDIGLANEYAGKLKQEFPLNLEARADTNFPESSDLYYTVQVGSFLSKRNAVSLSEKLNSKGYPAYLEEGVASGKAIYRVKVGKAAQRKEAQSLEKKLTKEGYPTKIVP